MKTETPSHCQLSIEVDVQSMLGGASSRPTIGPTKRGAPWGLCMANKNEGKCPSCKRFSLSMSAIP